MLDVLVADPEFGMASAQLLDQQLGRGGLLLCPVSFVELAPAFAGDVSRQRRFLSKVGIGFDEDWQFADTQAAHAAWHQQVRRRRAKTVAKRPVADILIGAFALRQSGLLTRNPRDFRAAFPTLALIEP